MFKTIWFVFVFMSVLGFLIYLNSFPKTKQAEILQIPSILNDSDSISNPNVEIINNINLNNSKINNIYYPRILVQSNGIKLQSTFLYEKNNKFRMKSWSVFGIESDIGSNEKVFWFWSKRMSPSALFFSAHENLSKTRLKTPFHPNWMMETIGIDEIKLKDSIVFDYKNYICVAQSKIDIINKQPVTRVYLIDKQKNAVYGNYLFNSNHKLIVSFEIYDYYKVNGNYYPKEVGIVWYQESINLRWNLDCPIINSQLNKSNWEMPFINPKIDLNNY